MCTRQGKAESDCDSNMESVASRAAAGCVGASCSRRRCGALPSGRRAPRASVCHAQTEAEKCAEPRCPSRPFPRPGDKQLSSFARACPSRRA